MKKLISIIIAMAVTLSMTLPIFADREYYDEQGRVVKINHVSGGAGSYINYDYDENGNLVKESSYAASSGLITTKYHFYDENGLRVKSIKKYNLMWGNNFIHYEYDENGVLIKDTELEWDYVYETFYEYGEDGKLVAKVTPDTETRIEYGVDGVVVRAEDAWGVTTYDEYGNLTASGSNTCENEYDEHGNLVKQVFYSDSYKSTNVFAYDESGNCIRYDYAEEYYENDEYNSSYYCEFTYDDDGNILKEDYGDAVWTHEYDENRNVVKETYKSDYGETNHIYEYDELGNKTRDETVYADGDIEIYTEEYDENRNVIKSVSTSTADNEVSTVFHEYDENKELLVDSFAIIQGETGVEFDYEEMFAYGDVDLNGAVDIADLVGVSKYVMGNSALDVKGFYIADISRDGVVNSIDMALLKNIVISS